MTEDEVLIERIRPLLEGRAGFSEKKMFGGVCFLINGNMCLGTWKGSLIVRLGKDKHEETLARPHTQPANITGRVMKGWALVEPAGLESERDLKTWVGEAATFAESLPPK
ncbi:MAG: TfoX/Sxy family protein [Gammaproteobacteria bacterium]|nr:TfoX/Sxy family protein [Gammaproteobacteria bacterium]MYF59594.1 TfoX/Sxy family protein [Gammaproteobacteria bacterium]